MLQSIEQRGGAGGKTLSLNVQLCSPELRAFLDLPTNITKHPFHSPLKRRVDDQRIAIAQDKQRIIAPALAHPQGSPERVNAIEALTGVQHQIGGKWKMVSRRTIYDWIKAAETNTVDLLPKPRSDKDQHRVLISAAWDSGCGLPHDVQLQIASEIARTARGLLAKGRSAASVRRLCEPRLQRLTVEAGANLTPAALKKACKITQKWTDRFTEMKAVNAFMVDHKVYADKHEFHVKRSLTARPMEALMGDVHTVDISVPEAMSSAFKAVRTMGFAAAMAGKVSVKVWFIAWMDAASGYMWATPVITGPGQGISQRDVAWSLYSVLTCPWGGMPDTFILDNGSEYAFLVDAVTRFAAMAELYGPKVIKCRPYHPEGKARIEGAFQVIEKGFISALPGYNGGNFLKPRLTGRGKLVAPYDRGPERLMEDLHLAIAQYNGTPQNGDLEGLSPKAMLEAKAEATGWQAQRIDPKDDTMFDLVFSKEERRDVRQGTVTIGKRRYSTSVLAEMIGEKQVPILVPYRNPDGPALLLRDGVIHKLTHETFGVTDLEGSKRKSEMVSLQRAEMHRRKATADMDVDVQQMLSDDADLSPVQHNGPVTWTVDAIDKGGFLSAPISAEEARRQQEDQVRADMEEFLAERRPRKREASGGNRQPL